MCKVVVQFPSGGVFIGSAIMVGPRHALTAGHMLFDSEEGGWAAQVIVAPAYDDGYTPFGYYEAETLYSLVGFIQDDNLNYDFGMVEFSANVGDTTGWLGYSALSDVELQGRLLHTAGFPGDRRQGERMYGADGPCFDVSTKQVYFAGTMDSASGQSGSGVWTIIDGAPSVVAVLTFGSLSFNGGTRITQGLFDYIQYVKDPQGGGLPEPPPPPPPGTVINLGLNLQGSRLSDSFYPGEDSAQLRMAFLYNPLSEDFLINPIRDGIAISVECNGAESLLFSLNSDDPRWRASLRRGLVKKAKWSRRIGKVRVRFYLDAVKKEAYLRIDGFDFSAPLLFPTVVSVVCGNDYGRDGGDGWFQLSPGTILY